MRGHASDKNFVCYLMRMSSNTNKFKTVGGWPAARKRRSKPNVMERGYRRMSNNIVLLIQIGPQNREQGVVHLYGSSSANCSSGVVYHRAGRPDPRRSTPNCWLVTGPTGLVARTPARARSTAGWFMVCFVADPLETMNHRCQNRSIGL